MLLRESGIRLPFFDLRLPLVRFFQVVPFLVLVLHANLLLYLEALWRRLLAFEAGERPWLATLHPMAAVQRLTLESRDRWLRRLFQLAFVVPILLPTAVLLLMQRAILPYRDGIAAYVAGCVTVDCLVLAFFFLSTVRDRRSETRWFRALRLRGRPAIVAVVVFALLACGISWMMFIPASWQRLVVRDSLLIEAEPPPELAVRQLDKGLEMEEIVRRYSTGLDLSGRDLRGADLTDSSLFNVDLRGAVLDGALLDRVDLRGGTLDPLGQTSRIGRTKKAIAGIAEQGRTSLVRARLRGAVMTGVTAIGADFSNAEMDGIHFEGGTLWGARMGGVTAESGAFTAADFFAAGLDRAVLRSSDLIAASLEAASLIGTDASEAALLGADARQSILYLTQLRGADLRAVDFTGAGPWATDLSISRLWGAGGLRVENSLLWKAAVRGALFELPKDGSADLRDLDVEADHSLPAGGWAEILRFEPKTASREWLIADAGSNELSRQALDRIREQSRRVQAAPSPSLPESTPPLHCIVGRIACRLLARLAEPTADTLDRHLDAELKNLDPQASDRVDDPWDDLWRSLGRVRADAGACAPGGTENCKELTQP